MSLRQLLAMATHLEERTGKGVRVMVEPLDAAALDAFCIHARALIEFLWRDRSGRHGTKPRRGNALAADWFESGVWAELERYPDLPDELKGVARRTGWGRGAHQL